MLGARSHIQHQARGGLRPGSSQPSGEKEAPEVTKPQGQKHWETIPLPLLPKHHSQGGEQHFALCKGSLSRYDDGLTKGG